MILRKNRSKVTAEDFFKLQLEINDLVTYIQDCQFVGKIKNKYSIESNKLKRQSIINLSKIEKLRVQANRTSRRHSILNIEEDINAIYSSLKFKNDKSSIFARYRTGFSHYQQQVIIKFMTILEQRNMFQGEIDYNRSILLLHQNVGKIYDGIIQNYKGGV